MTSNNVLFNAKSKDDAQVQANSMSKLGVAGRVPLAPDPCPRPNRNTQERVALWFNTNAHGERRVHDEASQYGHTFSHKIVSNRR